MKNNNLITVKNVSYSYFAENSYETVLKDISLTVDAGEIIAIVGPSGCGKTTLLNIISGLAQATQGNVEYCEGLQGRIGYIFQFDSLLPWRTVEGNLLLPTELSKCQEKDDFDKTIGRYLDAFNLPESVKIKYPSELSGGMRQRVSIIQSLLSNPNILLLDEPFSSLDYYTKLSLEDEFWQLVKNEKKGAVFVTHDISEAISMSDKIIIMKANPGEIMKTLTLEKDIMPENMRSHPKYTEYFHLVWGELKVLMEQSKEKQYV